MNDKVFKVLSSCFLVAGVSRSLIIDSQRWQYYTIPNPMYTLLKAYDGWSVADVKQKLATTREEEKILDEYFDFLFEHEIIFECDQGLADQFVPMRVDFEHPSAITNAIIEMEQLVSGDLDSILLQLTSLGCYTVEIRINKLTDSPVISRLLELCRKNELENVSLIVQTGESISVLNAYLKEYVFLTQIINYNQKLANQETEGIIFTSKDLSQSKSCGLVLSGFFTPTLQHFTESLAHNTCLNRKIAIDAKGNIKNCPSMQETFGNVKDTALQEAYNKPGFKKYWNIKKEEITKCKDCEFRHVCTDCRAYLDNPDDIYSAPLKCGYDPYTCTWETWSTNPLKQAAIHYYQMDL